MPETVTVQSPVATTIIEEGVRFDEVERIGRFFLGEDEKGRAVWKSYKRDLFGSHTGKAWEDDSKMIAKGENNDDNSCLLSAWPSAKPFTRIDFISSPALMKQLPLSPFFW